MSMALSHISLVVVLFITTGVVAHVRQGDGLLYSARGARNDSGGCTHQRGFVGVGITCAVPAGEYDAGKNCGRCVRVEAYLDGALMQTPSIGPLFATVVDVCEECKPGDLEIGLAGEGPLRVTWEFVPCATARESSGRGGRLRRRLKS